jgi:hypothetical protein
MRKRKRIPHKVKEVVMQKEQKQKWFKQKEEKHQKEENLMIFYFS